MTSAFEELKKSRARLVSVFPEQETGCAFHADHTEIMDRYFRGSLQDSRAGHLLFNRKTPLALLAVGGYGREELSLHSDVDIVILFGPKIPSLAKELTEEIFYPLWDLGLELGYGTRTLKDCLGLCRQDFQVFTSMMDARFLCGDSTLYLKLVASLEKKVTPKRAVAFSRWLEEMYKIRMDIFGDASYLLEPNLKEGIGGLRDYHHIVWIAKAFFRLTAPRDLEFLGKLSHSEYKELTEHLDFIWRVRNHLHQLSGRKNDRLSFEYQEEIAERLGYRDQENLLAVEEFMGRLHASMAALKSLRCSFVKTHLPVGRGIANAFRSSDVIEDLYTHRGEIGFDSATAILSNPLLLINIFEQSARSGYPLSLEARRLVREFLFLVDERFRSSQEAVQGFLNIINRRNAFETLTQMHEVGFLGAFIPEFSKITDRVQFDAYHTFPVGRHSLETVRYLKGVNQGDGMLFLDILLDLSDPGSLFLAGLFHDIGKIGKGHAVRGAGIARDILRRFNYPEDATQKVLFLIRHHLFLVETATRRDLTDEKVVVQCARTIGNIERLKMLYLLTWADSRATGPRAWNEWTANLVQELFFKVLHILARGELATVDASQTVQHTMEQVRQRVAQEEKPIDPEPFFEVMSSRYLLTCRPRDVVNHIKMAKGLRPQIDHQGPSAFCLETRKHVSEDCFEITFLAEDRPGLFSEVAGVLALNDINILSADIYTWRDGMAVDLFKVTSPPDPINPGRTWRKVRESLEGVFTGKLSLSYRLGQKGEKTLLSDIKRPSRPPKVMVDNRSSDFHTIIEVFADDRVGLLYLITKTLFDLRLDIVIAKIATKGDQIADVFYVRDLEGQKIDDGAHLKEIEAALRYELIRK